MKITLYVLLIFLSFLPETSSADTIGKGEDGYFGIQFSIPLDTGPKSKLIANANINILLINSKEDYADGIAIGFDNLEFRSLSYLRPSSNLGVSQNSIRKHSITLMKANSSAESVKTNVELDGGTIVMYGVVGIILFSDALKDFYEDLVNDDDE